MCARIESAEPSSLPRRAPAAERVRRAARAGPRRLSARACARRGVSLDRCDLEACYAQAWQGLYAATLDGREIANPSAWLALVTFRRAIEEHRAQIGAQGRCAPPPRECDLAADLDDRVRLRQLFEGLCARLSGREREAATLCYLQGLSRSEAAARLGVSELRMRRLMDGRGAGRPGVAGKVGELAEAIRAGDWCEQQGSLMRGLAYGVLDPDGRPLQARAAAQPRVPGVSRLRRLVARSGGGAAAGVPALRDHCGGACATRRRSSPRSSGQRRRSGRGDGRRGQTRAARSRRDSAALFRRRRGRRLGRRGWGLADHGRARRQARRRMSARAGRRGGLCRPRPRRRARAPPAPGPSLSAGASGGRGKRAASTGDRRSLLAPRAPGRSPRRAARAQPRAPPQARVRTGERARSIARSLQCPRGTSRRAASGGLAHQHGDGAELARPRSTGASGKRAVALSCRRAMPRRQRESSHPDRRNRAGPALRLERLEEVGDVACDGVAVATAGAAQLLGLLGERPRGSLGSATRARPHRWPLPGTVISQSRLRSGLSRCVGEPHRCETAWSRP